MSRKTKNIVIVLLVIISIFLLIPLYKSYESYNDLVKDYNYLLTKHNELNESYNDLVKESNDLLNNYNELDESYKAFQNEVLNRVEDNYTAVTIIYSTNFSKNQQIITLSIPYEKYNASLYKKHPNWDNETLTSALDYITDNETTINQIVETIKSQTQSKEELANALLNFVQDKGNGLSIRYYPTNELKYPIETLVEMGGDCDTHAFLCGTLMKAAGFKVLLLLSKENIDGQPHTATAIHLENPPENSLPDYQDYSFTYDGETYYYAETTNANWRIGDLPPKFENLNFHLIPI